MAHGYSTIQNWDQWLAQHALGEKLIAAEQQLLGHLLCRAYGKHGVLVGVQRQCALLHSSETTCHSLVSPLRVGEKRINVIEADLYELPILTGSIDLVILPHTLELVDNPRQLLAEACRIIKPEGLIAICGFNPYSLWGIKRLLTKKRKLPWAVNFIHSHLIKKWLRLADFVLEKYSTILFTPPISQHHFYNKLQFFERIGRVCWPLFGGVYVLVARAKVIPLTPIRMQWKQRLSDIPISTSISTGHARY